MVHSAILKKIVFCLALLLRQSVQLLETGYKYPSNNVPIENDSLYDDLKCAYLFSGLTHMRLVKLLIDRPYDPQTKLSTGHLASYSNVIKYQIASLYSVQVKRMGALWLVHLYTSMVTWSYENLKNEAEDYKKMVATTEYVIEKLLKDITGCREGNSFDRYHRIIKPNSNPKPVVLKKMMGLVNSEANKLLAKNYIVFQEKLCDCHFQETLKIRNIFMNGLGLYDAYKTDLMNVYNVNVDWSDTSKRLEKSWYDARTLDWATDNLENIKSYLTLCYSFLKILMFRLTLKHLQYLQNYIESDEYVLYAHQWYNLVDTFGSMLNLTKDLHVKSLLTAIYNLCNGIEKVDSVVSYVVSILVSLCLSFGCVATEPFLITDDKEFKTPYTSVIKYDMERLETTTSRVPIEYNSLENTRVFLYYLSQVFKNVDFRFIQLLIEYIDEIEIENYTERFQNFRINS